MSHVIKSYAELSWPVAAVETIADRDRSPKLLTWIPNKTLLSTGTVLVVAVQISRDFLGQVGAWHHGGINE